MVRILKPSDIRAFWIIHRQSGVGIFEQSFKGDVGDSEDLSCKVDPFVIQGYLYAVAHLSTEITNQNIEFIQLERLRIYYNLSKSFIFIVIAKKQVSSTRINVILEKLQNRFEAKYYPNVEHGFSGDITAYRTFAKEIEEELQAETQYFQFLQKRSDQLQDLFQSAKHQWTKIQNDIIDHSQSFGTWIMKSQEHVKPEAISTIGNHRSIQKQDQDPSQPKTKKSSWV